MSRKEATCLEIFDFDSTLFRSPLPNPRLWSSALRGRIISDCEWFSDIRTLSPPFIPLVPPNSFWHNQTVGSAVEAIQSSKTIAVLLTGRKQSFAQRIIQICRSKQPTLNFHAFYFKHSPTNTHISTIDFKLATIDSVLAENPTINFIRLYDDRSRHITIFNTFLSSLVSTARITSFDVVHVIQEKALEQYIDPTLEFSLVSDLINSLNKRIENAKAKNSLASNQTEPAPIHELSQEEESVEESLPHDLHLVQEPLSTESLSGQQHHVINQPILDTNQTSSATDQPNDQAILAPKPSHSSTLVSQTLTPKNKLRNPPPIPSPSILLYHQSQHQRQQIAQSQSINDTQILFNPSQPIPKSTQKQQKLKIRRISISVYRSPIQITQVLHYSCIRLSDESKSSLISLFPAPDGWIECAESMTIGMGHSGDDIVTQLGGPNTSVSLTVTHYGEIANKIQAVRVKLCKTATTPHNVDNDAVISVSKYPHVTVNVSSDSMPHESNTIDEWIPITQYLESRSPSYHPPLPFIITGTTTNTMIYDLITQSKSSASVSHNPPGISLGNLIMKHHPSLKGPQIGQAIQKVREWMSRNCVDESDGNVNTAWIEWYIQNMMDDETKDDDHGCGESGLAKS